MDDIDVIILESENRKLKERISVLERELNGRKAYCDMMHNLADKQAAKIEEFERKNNSDNIGEMYIRDIFTTR